MSPKTPERRAFVIIFLQLLADKVAAGELGAKTGRGFYAYVETRDRLVQERQQSRSTSSSSGAANSLFVTALPST